MPSQIRISAKNLGEVALPNFCSRCFWLKRRVANLPFQIFPGIFSSIDSYTKKTIHGWFDNLQEMPSWLRNLGNLVSYYPPLHYSKFNMVDTATNILLTGSPDDVFTREDGSYVIVDYKTAKYTGNQDHLFPIYEVQLNAYAMIGEQFGLKPISDLALIYMEPMTNDEEANDDMNRRANGFAMSFSASIHMVQMNTAIIPPLLQRVREIHDLEVAPSGYNGCKDCESVNNLVAAIG